MNAKDRGVTAVAVGGERYLLMFSKDPELSPAGEAERKRRVAAGENPLLVFAEILVREGKAVGDAI